MPGIQDWLVTAPSSFPDQGTVTHRVLHLQQHQVKKKINKYTNLLLKKGF